MTTDFQAVELEPAWPPKETLPTMYDLPSEEVGQPGMPDLFHEWQARLLDETFQPPGYTPTEFFTAIDMNLYYDVNDFSHYKRPDWFAVVGLPKLEEEPDLRLSYVIWQERVTPLIVVELLSPSTQKEDLGQTLRDIDGSPTKWEVYERWLRVPYYVTFSRYTNELRVCKLTAGSYKAAKLQQGRLWIPKAGLSLGLWRGRYLKSSERLWLRWFDRAGNLIPTSAERAAQQQHLREQGQRLLAQERQRAKQEQQRAEQERQRAEQERQRAEQELKEKEAAVQKAQQLAAKLRELGIDPDQM